MTTPGKGAVEASVSAHGLRSLWSGCSPLGKDAWLEVCDVEKVQISRPVLSLLSAGCDQYHDLSLPGGSGRA